MDLRLVAFSLPCRILLAMCYSTIISAICCCLFLESFPQGRLLSETRQFRSTPYTIRRLPFVFTHKSQLESVRRLIYRWAHLYCGIWACLRIVHMYIMCAWRWWRCPRSSQCTTTTTPFVIDNKLLLLAFEWGNS